MESDQKKIPTVLLTGFGLFRDYARNSSQLVVERLSTQGLPFPCVLHTEIVPVEYDRVREIVPQLWQKYQPDITIHCGMSHVAHQLTIEKCARLEGYCSPDTRGCLPGKFCAGNVSCDPPVLKTGIDVDAIVKSVNALCNKVGVTDSTCAGNYLCEYIYYCSLKISERTVFIHIPSLDHGQTCTVDDLVQTLTSVIQQIVKFYFPQ